jgi:hypothetical protein
MAGAVWKFGRDGRLGRIFFHRRVAPGGRISSRNNDAWIYYKIHRDGRIKPQVSKFPKTNF